MITYQPIKKKESFKLLFEWPSKKIPKLSLPLCVVFAALLHISAIYLFDIVYQSPHVSKPVAAQVLFLLPGSPSSRQLSAWLTSNDSAIFSPLKTAQAIRPNIPTDIYQPHQSSLPLRSLPDLKKQATELPLLPTVETVLPSTSSISSKETSSSTTVTTLNPVSTTSIQLLEKLAARQPSPPLSLGYPELSETVNQQLPPTELTVNIDAAGTPQHVFVIRSSGNSTADEAATQWLMSCHFAPASQETWGNLLVLWGNNGNKAEKQNKTNNMTPSQPLIPSTI